jgi:hypothetical protein
LAFNADNKKPSRSRAEITADLKNPKLAQYQKEWRARKKLKQLFPKSDMAGAERAKTLPY